MKIYVGADHGGYELKDKVRQWLTEWGYQSEDVGAHQLDPADDYPEFAFKVAEKVASEADAVGVLLCRSGGGVTIAANKVRGIRAVPVYTVEQAQHARRDNDANVISLAGDWVTDEEVKALLKTYLETPYSKAKRHQRRLDQIAAYENR